MIIFGSLVVINVSKAFLFRLEAKVQKEAKYAPAEDSGLMFILCLCMKPFSNIYIFILIYHNVLAVVCLWSRR